MFTGGRIQAAACPNQFVGRPDSVWSRSVRFQYLGNGKIAESHAGMVDKDAFEADIRALLQANTKKRK